MRAALSVTATLLATACLIPLDPADRLDLTMELSMTRINADTGLIIHLIATNRHWQTVHLRAVHDCILGYRLIGPDNTDLPPYGSACVLIGRDRDLAPGESIVREVHFVPRPHVGGTSGVKRWPPGQYHVVGQLFGEHFKIVKETEPVAFELACRDPSWTEC